MLAATAAGTVFKKRRRAARDTSPERLGTDPPENATGADPNIPLAGIFQQADEKASLQGRREKALLPSPFQAAFFSSLSVTWRGSSTYNDRTTWLTHPSTYCLSKTTI